MPRGLFSAMFLSQKRIQWKTIDWVTLESNVGQLLMLTEVRPGLLKVLLRHAVIRNLERLAAQKISSGGPKVMLRRALEGPGFE
eukprot:1077581-Pyramimonas_sp.AAC.1